MGQRFQVYVQYNNEQVLVAKHLQWCWGHFSIIRAYQILDFLKKSIEDDYSPFLSNNYEYIKYDKNCDVRILNSLIELNATYGSFVNSHDLLEEQFKYFADENERYKNISINPFCQDNNDGILVVKIVEEENKEPIIKYAFDFLNNNYFNPISAKDYWEQQDPSDRKSYKQREKLDKKLSKIIDSYISFIENEGFEILTQKELEDIFFLNKNEISNLKRKTKRRVNLSTYEKVLEEEQYKQNLNYGYLQLLLRPYNTKLCLSHIETPTKETKSKEKILSDIILNLNQKLDYEGNMSLKELLSIADIKFKTIKIGD
jgi:hypothetical protein